VFFLVKLIQKFPLTKIFVLILIYFLAYYLDFGKIICVFGFIVVQIDNWNCVIKLGYSLFISMLGSI